MIRANFFRLGMVICLCVLILVIAIPSHALPIKFFIKSGSTLSIQGSNPIPISGSFEIDYVGIEDEGFGGGIKSEVFTISNLKVQTDTLTFTQVWSPYNEAYNLFDAGNSFIAGGFQVVTHAVGTIDSKAVDVTFQWGASQVESFIGNMLFGDGATLGSPGNDLVVNKAAGFDGVKFYSFRIQANTEPADNIEQAKKKILLCTGVPDWDYFDELMPCGTEFYSYLVTAQAQLSFNPVSLADNICDFYQEGDYCGIAKDLAKIGGLATTGSNLPGIAIDALSCIEEIGGINITGKVCDYIFRESIEWVGRFTLVLTHSPVDISIEDDDGNKLWMDSNSVVNNTLPEGGTIITLDGHREIAIIPDSQENYFIEIIGRPEAQLGDTFNLDIFHPLNETEILSLIFENVSVMPTTIASILIGPNITQYNLNIDEDGDGEVDFSVIPSLLNGEVFDNDGDGYGFDTDCDDSNPDINPSKYELPGNNIDENCDSSLACNTNESWKSHGQFVKCVAHETENLVNQGILTEEEGNVIISTSAQSDIKKN